MGSQTVAVIIPIYKNTLNEHEKLSLSQCLNILYKHPIIFVGPKDIDFKAYKSFCIGINYKIVNFGVEYFKDIDGYNRLMLSTDFYKHFLIFKFILIYQLDAFVFRDDLLYWCRQNYDFIGAPNPMHSNVPGEMQFLKNYDKIWRFLGQYFKLKHNISNVGNGGLSLRKTKKCYWMLKLLKYQIKSWNSMNEDGFFKYWGNLLYPFFKLPTDRIALMFSIESSPESAFKFLNNILPFGCHAWEKHQPEFWEEHIQFNKKHI